MVWWSDGLTAEGNNTPLSLPTHYLPVGIKEKGREYPVLSSFEHPVTSGVERVAQHDSLFAIRPR